MLRRTAEPVITALRPECFFQTRLSSESALPTYIRSWPR
jgi:hypothetical protein